MTPPASTVAVAIELACRTHMHTAGQAVKEAVQAHCNGDAGAARGWLDEASTALKNARNLCFITPAPAAPEEPSLL
jgi:hypothetical protein